LPLVNPRSAVVWSRFDGGTSNTMEPEARRRMISAILIVAFLQKIVWDAETRRHHCHSVFQKQFPSRAAVKFVNNLGTNQCSYNPIGIGRTISRSASKLLGVKRIHR